MSKRKDRVDAIGCMKHFFLIPVFRDFHQLWNKAKENISKDDEYFDF